MPTRDRAAAEVFLRKAIRTQGLPERITIDQSSGNTAAIQRDNGTHKTAIMIPPLQVSQQYRGARSSGRKTDDAAGAGVQVL